MFKKIPFLLSLVVYQWSGTAAAQGQTITFYGTLKESDAFEVHFNIVNNPGAKINAYPYQNYRLKLGQLRNIPSQDYPVLLEVLRKSLKKWQPKGTFSFRIENAENIRNVLFLVGETPLQEEPRFCAHVENDLQKTSFPTGRKYSINFKNRNYVFLPIGEADATNMTEVCDIINTRLANDHLIYGNPFFSDRIEHLDVE